MTQKNSKIQIGVVLEGDVKRKFEAVKKYYGLQKNADLVRLLITQKCEEIVAARK